MRASVLATVSTAIARGERGEGWENLNVEEKVLKALPALSFASSSFDDPRICHGFLTPWPQVHEESGVVMCLVVDEVCGNEYTLHFIFWRILSGLNPLTVP